MSRTLTISGKAKFITAASMLLLCANLITVAQDAIEPPSIGQITKGTPAIVETETVSTVEYQTSDQTATQDQTLFANAKVIERKRENGQVYRIELEHPLGARQYLDDDNMDGEVKTDDSSIEDAPNLAKWRIGSW